MFAQALRSGSLADMIGDRRAFRDAFLTTRDLLPLLEAREVDLRRHRGALLPFRLPQPVAAVTAALTRLVPFARRSLEAHTDPRTPEARAVLDDVRRAARRLGVPTTRLER
jgi:2-dehydropantoate 2-reductase